ncbi:MAG: flavoprotein [Pseudonocardiaceae bacterium]
MNQRVLYIVTCGAPLAARAADGVRAAREREWWPVVIPTEASRPWIDLEELGDVVVSTNHRSPDDARRIPPADALAVVPATFNTLNAWANGTANTYPLATLCALLGARVPAVAVPFAKHDLAGHPAWLASLAVLRYAGVEVVDPRTGAVGMAEPITSGSGQQVTEAFRWSWVLDKLDQVRGIDQ